MILVSDRCRGELIGMRVLGRAAEREPARLVPLLESLLRQHGSRRCVVELVGFDGVVLRGVWDAMQADARWCRGLERCALVGDPASRRGARKLFGAVFCKAELRFFATARREDAWHWAEAGLLETAGA